MLLHDTSVLIQGTEVHVSLAQRRVSQSQTFIVSLELVRKLHPHRQTSFGRSTTDIRHLLSALQ